METVRCGSCALSPNQVFNPKSGDRRYFSKGHCKNRTPIMTVPKAATGQGKGGGLLDMPVIEKSTPSRESEFNLRKLRKRASPYRVLLLNDNHNVQDYVVEVLVKVIPGMTRENAFIIMEEAHYNGFSVVIICDQADAEEHCMHLRGSGLTSSIEPAS